MIVSSVGLVGGAVAQAESSDAGRDALKKILGQAGKFNGHMVIRRSTGSDGMPPTELETTIDIYRSGSKFLLESNEFFGGGARQTCDGKILLDDPWDSVVFLKDAPVSFSDKNFAGSAMGGGGFFFHSLQGEPALADLVDEKTSVDLKESSGGQTLSFAHKWGGQMRLFASGGKVVWVEYESARQGFRGGGGTQVYRDTVVFVDEKYKFGRNFFSTTPFPGVAVQDQRKKG